MALPDRGDPQVASGLDAAGLLRRAVDLAEPALPRLVTVTDRAVPVDAGEFGFEDARFLAERNLLPVAWNPDALEPGVWSDMLNRFTAWYGLPPVAHDEPVSDADLLADLASTLERVSGVVRPVALFADLADGAGHAFRGVIWNWSVYPRLLVFRPDSEHAFEGSPMQSMAALENCVRRIRHYFAAPVTTAQRLFLANNRAQMVIVAGEPTADASEAEASDEGVSPDDWPVWVDSGDELAAFTFRHPSTADLAAYSAVFAGPSIGLGALARLLPRIRTNVSPFELRRYLQTP